MSPVPADCCKFLVGKAGSASWGQTLRPSRSFEGIRSPFWGGVGRPPQTPGQNLGPKGDVSGRQAGGHQGSAVGGVWEPGCPPLYAAPQLCGSGQAGQVSALSSLPLGCESLPPLMVLVESVSSWEAPKTALPGTGPSAPPPLLFIIGNIIINELIQQD